MENKFNEQDSLKLISEMITQTRNNIQVGSANSIIFCGYFVAATAITEVILVNFSTLSHKVNWIWLLMIPMYFISLIINRRKDKRAIVRTPIDRITHSIWIGFTISIIIALSTIFASVYVFQTWLVCIFITPVLLLLTGLAQYMTGTVSKFRPFINGAYIFWIGALLSVFSYKVFGNDNGQFIILAICMITGFVIPGHILNRKAKEHV
ncbi:MAG: hypothetical protein ACK5MK_14135 [Dysgonomonas sp.]